MLSVESWSSPKGPQKNAAEPLNESNANRGLSGVVRINIVRLSAMFPRDCGRSGLSVEARAFPSLLCTPQSHNVGLRDHLPRWRSLHQAHLSAQSVSG